MSSKHIQLQVLRFPTTFMLTNKSKFTAPQLSYGRHMSGSYETKYLSKQTGTELLYLDSIEWKREVHPSSSIHWARRMLFYPFVSTMTKAADSHYIFLVALYLNGFSNKNQNVGILFNISNTLVRSVKLICIRNMYAFVRQQSDTV